MGEAYAQMGRIDEARRFLKKSLAVRQELLSRSPADVQTACNLAWTYAEVGWNAARSGDLSAASEAYREASQRYERLMHSGKKLSDLDVRLFGIVQSKIEYCSMAEKSVADLDFALRQSDAVVPKMLSARVHVFSAKRDLPNLTATAKEYAKLAEKNNTHAYNAACAWSLASGISETAVSKNEAAIEALRLLRRTPVGPKSLRPTKARLAGFIDVDRDFDAIRNRDDFRAFVSELKAAPNKE